jgi:hypothetical protein
MTTIGFFGDSFCADISSVYTETYLQKLARHFSSEITHVGISGSSVWDTVIKQLLPLIKNNSVPDICVFVWTEHSRLYHDSIRNINVSTLDDLKDPLKKSVELYYNHLYNDIQSRLAYTSLLYYVDKELCAKLSCKIVHLWGFGFAKTKLTITDFISPTPLKIIDNKFFNSKNIDFAIRWQNGVEIRPCLMSLIDLDNWSLASNHIPDAKTNEMIFLAVKDAVENYQNGRCIYF